MASPTVESTAYGDSGGNTTSHVVTMPTGVTAGDLLFIFIACNDSVTFTPPGGWTQLYQGTNNGGGLDMTGAGFYKKSDGTEGASETVTSSASRTSGWTAYRISGHDPLTAPAVTVINTGASANPNPVSLSPAGGSDDYLWLAVQHHRRVTSVTSYPSGYSGGINGTVGGGGANTGSASAHKTSTASSEDPGAFTNDNDKIWMAVTVGVYPAPPVTANETITFEGFESGALYDMDVTQGANGSFTASSAQASNGTYSARVQATSTTSNQAYLNLPWYFDTRGVVYTASNFSHINVQFRLRIATAPAGDVRLVYANNATTYPLYLTSARKIKLDTQESAALDLNTWYTVAYQARGDRRWQVTVWNADLSQQIFSYGTLLVGGAITHSELRIGITESTTNANGMDVYLDDILVEADNTAFPITPRDYAIKKKGIAGNGTHTAWSSDYTRIDEIPISDNVADDIAATADGQIETFSLNSNATDGIDAGRYLGVKVDTGFDVGETSIVDNTVVLYSGTTRDDSEAYPFADGDLHRFRKIFETDPDTGAEWTDAGIEAMEPGVRCVTDGANNRCLWVAVEVAYILPLPVEKHPLWGGRNDMPDDPRPGQRDYLVRDQRMLLHPDVGTFGEPPNATILATRNDMPDDPRPGQRDYIFRDVGWVWSPTLYPDPLPPNVAVLIARNDMGADPRAGQRDYLFRTAGWVWPRSLFPAVFPPNVAILVTRNDMADDPRTGQRDYLLRATYRYERSLYPDPLPPNVAALVARNDMGADPRAGQLQYFLRLPNPEVWRKRFYGTARGMYRVANAAEYRFYRKEDEAPIVGVDSPFATNATLPYEPSDTYSDGTWYVGVTYFDGFIESDFLFTKVVTVDSGAAAGDPPSAPLEWLARAIAGGAVRVEGLYWPLPDGLNKADAWAIWYTTDGSAPDPTAAADVTVAMQGSNMQALAYNLPAQSHGTTVKVLVRARRSGTPNVDSTNTAVQTVTADAQGPSAPVSAEVWRGRTPEGV